MGSKKHELLTSANEIITRSVYWKIEPDIREKPSIQNVAVTTRDFSLHSVDIFVQQVF